MISLKGVCPLCGGEGLLLASLSGESLYSCSGCGFTPVGFQDSAQLAAEAWDQYSAPSIEGAKLNIVAWSWADAGGAGYVVTDQIEEARAAISAGHRVIPVYAADKGAGNES